MVVSAPTNASGTRPVSSITRRRPNTSCGYGSVPIAICEPCGSGCSQSISAPLRGKTTVGGSMPTLTNTGALAGPP